MFDKKKSYDKKVRQQRDAYAILACKNLGFDVAKTGHLLKMPFRMVEDMFYLIDNDMIEWDKF